MAILVGQIRSIQIVNQFNNGAVYEVGKEILHFVGSDPKLHKVCEILESSTSCYCQYTIIVSDVEGNKIVHKTLRSVSVIVEYY